MRFSLSGLPAFDYLQPTTVGEALTMLDAQSSTRVYLGGTDLFPKMRKQILKPTTLIDLKWINDFPETMINENGEMVINPQATYSHILPYLGQFNGGAALFDAIVQIGTRSLRNRATLAGNICNASAAADSVAALIACGAYLTLQSKSGSRNVNVEKFILGPVETVCQSDEILTKISIPAQPANCAGTYLKISRNKAADLAICGVAVVVCHSAKHPSGLAYKIVINGANPRPLQAEDACQFLAKQQPQISFLQEAARMAADAVTPLSDLRSSQAYRREMVYELTLQALKICLEKLGKEMLV
ncbi:MAG: FAD binding domain-containing protein [Anaerolineaceae bacterium]|nr:FAD binding domain-containing protein [Anaerolineaceae bacterium]